MSHSHSSGSESYQPLLVNRRNTSIDTASVSVEKKDSFKPPKTRAIMSDLFETYGEEFERSLGEVKAVIQELANSSTSTASSSAESEERRRKLEDVEPQLSEAESLIRQMEVEVRGLNGEIKTKLQQVLQGYKNTMKTTRDEFLAAMSREEKSILLGVSPTHGSAEHRQRLLNTNEKISRQNEKISRSLQVVAETERVALEIGDELDRNTETIEGIHGKVREVSTMTGTARRLIQGMTNRAARHRCMLWFVALLLLVIIILVIYFAVKKGKDTVEPGSDASGDSDPDGSG